MIGTYADYLPGSEQYKWLKNDLKAVDRSQTPWLIAFMHAPWWVHPPLQTRDFEGRELQSRVLCSCKESVRVNFLSLLILSINLS